MSPRRAQLAALALALPLAPLLTGCERVMRDMYEQPRLGPEAESALFADKRGTRPPPAGSVAAAMGDLALASGGRRGREELEARDAAGRASDLAQAVPTLTRAILERGRTRFDIDCAPCHSPLGDGDGPVVRRGFPHPPSFHEDRLRTAPDRHFYEVMTHGYGVMRPYADRLTPEDRWAVVAYVRALQWSRRAPIEALPGPLEARLRALPATAPPSAPPLAAPGERAARSGGAG